MDKVTDKFDILYGKKIEKPKGVIQIIHGMGEHCKRYKNFGEFFENRGYIVLGRNLKYHGERAEACGNLGRCLEGFGSIVDEQLSVTKEISEIYKEVPIYVLGHSMGSFIAQGYMKKTTSHIAGYIFQGSSYKSNLLWGSGKIISKITNSFFTNKKVEFFKNIIFLGNNIKFLKERDSLSWLTKDAESREEAKKDRYCNFSYFSEFYFEFFKFLDSLFKEDEFEDVDKNKKILLISGGDDPIGGYGERVKKLYDFYISNRFNNVELKIIQNIRHEPQNEVKDDREKYFDYVLQWLEKS